MKGSGSNWCRGYKQVLFHVLFIGIVFFSMNRAFSQGVCGKVSMADGILTMVPDFPEDMLNDSTGVLCGGIGFTVRYGPDFEYTDPVPSTPSGLRLLVFTVRPDIDGWVNLNQLREHPGILKDGDGAPLVVGTDSSYRIAYEGLWVKPFGLSYPARIWLVPVIVDNANPVAGTSYFENENCIFIRTSELFSIIMVNSAGPDPHYLRYDRNLEQFIYTLKGGLPEYDPERFDYDFEVINTVTGESLDLIRYSDRVFGFRPVGLKGIYNIYTGNENGLGCGGSIVGLPLSVPQPILFIPDTTSYTGEEVCMPVTVKEFVDIDSFSFTLDWDAEVLKFNDIGGIDSSSFPSGQFSYDYEPGDDFVSISWTGGDGPVTLSDGAVLMELCFDVIGGNGDRSPVKTEGTDNRFYLGAEYLDPRIIHGSVRIVPDNFIDFSYTVINCSQGPMDRVNVLFSIVGKNPPFTISFDPFNLGSLTMENNRDTLFLIPEDTYTITVTDAVGETGMKVNQVIKDRGEMIHFSIDGKQTWAPLCHGANTGQIALDLDSNPGSVTIGYYRTGGDTMTTGDVLISGLEAGEYHVWVENKEECGENVVRTVQLEDAAKLSIDVEDRELGCADSGIVINFSDEVEGGSGPVEYSLDGVTFRNVTTDTLLPEGEYTVSISDENGCMASGDFWIRSVSSDLSFAFDVAGDSLHIGEGEVFELIANIDGSDRELKYEWQGAGGELLEEDKNRARFVFNTDGMVKLTIVDAMGCSYSDSIPVNVLKKDEEEPGEITMANIITPNGDGWNDRLTLWPVAHIRSISQMIVYDRYGNMIWSRKGLDPRQLPETGWNGQSDRGEAVLPGVYLVVADIEMDSGKTKQVSGDVMVVR